MWHKWWVLALPSKQELLSELDGSQGPRAMERGIHLSVSCVALRLPGFLTLFLFKCVSTWKYSATKAYPLTWEPLKLSAMSLSWWVPTHATMGDTELDLRGQSVSLLPFHNSYCPFCPPGCITKSKSRLRNPMRAKRPPQMATGSKSWLFLAAASPANIMGLDPPKRPGSGGLFLASSVRESKTSCF